MIWYAIRKQPRPPGVLKQEIVAALFAIFVVSPLAYWTFDSTPPWTRISGRIDPTPAGGWILAHWKTTPLTRRCPGIIQIEIIVGDLIWPVFSRPAKTGLGEAVNIEFGQHEWNPPPWPLPRDIPPGPAIYRVTSFWYCNWLQELDGWGISQVGPDIPFTVLPSASEERRNARTPQ